MQLYQHLMIQKMSELKYNSYIYIYRFCMGGTVANNCGMDSTCMIVFIGVYPTLIITMSNSLSVPMYLSDYACHNTSSTCASHTESDAL